MEIVPKPKSVFDKGFVFYLYDFLEKGGISEMLLDNVEKIYRDLVKNYKLKENEFIKKTWRFDILPIENYCVLERIYFYEGGDDIDFDYETIPSLLLYLSIIQKVRGLNIGCQTLFYTDYDGNRPGLLKINDINDESQLYIEFIRVIDCKLTRRVFSLDDLRNHDFMIGKDLAIKSPVIV